MAKKQRDPQGRRNLILRAAGELIREIGVSAVTHRKVAERADVPLGATTQYFNSLTDLIGEALSSMTGERERRMQEFAEEMAGVDDPAELIVGMLKESLSAPDRLRRELSFALAYATHPTLRQYIAPADELLVAALTQRTTPERARGVVAYAYGVMFDAAVKGFIAPTEELRANVRRLVEGGP